VLTSRRKGAVAEAAIAAEAIKLGLDVYWPLSEGGRYDLVLDTGARLLRVPCKWASCEGAVVVVWTQTSRLTPRGYVRTTYGRHEIDGVAAYCQELEKCFWLPIEEFEGRAHVHLRLTPARNNQRAGLKWAADYPLGAIAQLGERMTGSHEVGGSNPPSSTSNGTPLA
jgi:PD-(D/E)XK endonuclease